MKSNHDAIKEFCVARKSFVRVLYPNDYVTPGGSNMSKSGPIKVNQNKLTEATRILQKRFDELVKRGIEVQTIENMCDHPVLALECARDGYWVMFVNFIKVHSFSTQFY